MDVNSSNGDKMDALIDEELSKTEHKFDVSVDIMAKPVSPYTLITLFKTSNIHNYLTNNGTINCNLVALKHIMNNLYDADATENPEARRAAVKALVGVLPHLISVEASIPKVVSANNNNNNNNNNAGVISSVISSAMDTTHLHELNTTMLFIKAKFDEYIINDKYTELVPIYNQIFNDDLYANYNADIEMQLILTQEEITEMVAVYNANLIDRARRNKKLRPRLIFAKGEVVGAKDKEGKWWMARVLNTYQHDIHCIYYVEFFGWDEKFNEFIHEAHRIERFNPRKHRLFRAAWKKPTLETVEESLAN